METRGNSSPGGYKSSFVSKSRKKGVRSGIARCLVEEKKRGGSVNDHQIQIWIEGWGRRVLNSSTHLRGNRGRNLACRIGGFRDGRGPSGVKRKGLKKLRKTAWGDTERSHLNLMYDEGLHSKKGGKDSKGGSRTSLKGRKESGGDLGE